MIGQTDSTVLITGETGTGKEVIANPIHANSKRAKEPFIRVNCGAFNENLIESELFGSEKGAYTGVERQRKGRFEAANGGTVFFDEIRELSLPVQGSLLRVLQEKVFERVDGATPVHSGFRLIAATNRNLREEVNAGCFRADLYYRLNIIPVEVPPLREQKVDIEELSLDFFRRYAEEMNRKMRPLRGEILRAFWDCDWPDNVRELKNIIERTTRAISPRPPGSWESREKNSTKNWRITKFAVGDKAAAFFDRETGLAGEGPLRRGSGAAWTCGGRKAVIKFRYLMKDEEITYGF